MFSMFYSGKPKYQLDPVGYQKPTQNLKSNIYGF